MRAKWGAPPIQTRVSLNQPMPSTRVHTQGGSLSLPVLSKDPLPDGWIADFVALAILPALGTWTGEPSNWTQPQDEVGQR